LGKPDTPRITHQRAARAALAIIDADGLDAVSVDGVARALGVKAPSLYHHYRNKDAILVEAARLVLAEVEPLAVGASGWVEDIIRACVSVRRCVLRHPNAAPLLLHCLPRHGLLAAYDRAIGGYGELPSEWRLVLMEGTEKLAFGSTLFEAASRARGAPAMPTFDAARFP
jgi:AcrR family transcriptional regulator